MNELNEFKETRLEIVCLFGFLFVSLFVFAFVFSFCFCFLFCLFLFVLFCFVLFCFCFCFFFFCGYSNMSLDLHKQTNGIVKLNLTLKNL